MRFMDLRSFEGGTLVEYLERTGLFQEWGRAVIVSITIDQKGLTILTKKDRDAVAPAEQPTGIACLGTAPGQRWREMEHAGVIYLIPGATVIGTGACYAIAPRGASIPQPRERTSELLLALRSFWG